MRSVGARPPHAPCADTRHTSRSGKHPHVHPGGVDTRLPRLMGCDIPLPASDDPHGLRMCALLPLWKMVLVC